MKGTIKWFSEEKGYGFISVEDSEDYYFNVKDVVGVNLPSRGDAVNFDIAQSNKGLKAKNITIHKKSPEGTSHHTDDRVPCPNCGKRMVPRLITYRGEITHSACPFCGGTVKKFSQCFIATAVYGDVECRQVLALRNFRDTSLEKTSIGRVLMRFYYSVSPPVASWLKKHPKWSKAVRIALDLIAFSIPSQHKKTIDLKNRR